MVEKAKTVIIYSTPTCSYCIQAKEYFNDNKIKYKEYDVSENEKARTEMVTKSGQMGVPVIIIGKKVIIGFDKTEIKEALGL